MKSIKIGKRIGNKLIVYQEIESDVAEINSTVAHSTTNVSQQPEEQADSVSSTSLSSDSTTGRGLTELNVAVLERDLFLTQPRSVAEHPTAYKVESWLQHNNVSDKPTGLTIMINHSGIQELGHYENAEQLTKSWVDATLNPKNKPNINTNGGQQC